MTKSKVDLVCGWLEKARRDLITAERGLGAESPFTDIVCFHAQQATEKYLKAYLLWHEIEFPRTHALEDLVLLAAEKDRGFLQLKNEATTLTPYAVETRYPEFEVPLLEDARETVRIAGSIRDVVLTKLPKMCTETRCPPPSIGSQQGYRRAEARKHEEQRSDPKRRLT